MGHQRWQISNMHKVVRYTSLSFHGRFATLLHGLILILLFTPGCKQKDSIIPAIDQKAFTAYWMQGKAEISTYSIQQQFEGIMHTGNVKLIYMTEAFSKANFRKLENPSKHNENVVNVMKLNMAKTFITGISEHQVMTSVFAPVDYENYSHALKLTASYQDWSGQSYLQANYKGNRYEVLQFSNEGQGDQSYSWMSSTLEDELWVRIRVAPHTLPLGNIRIVPSAESLLLSNSDRKVNDATTRLENTASGFTYTIDYNDSERKLEIRFEKNFPYRILSWKEFDGKNQLSSGGLVTTQLNDYWNHNQPKDSTMRKEFYLK